MVIKGFVNQRDEKVTNVVSNALPEGYTATSLRLAAVTTMKRHALTNEHDVTERSGHDENSNKTSYYTHHSPASSIPGGMALCGYCNIRESPVPAKLPSSEFTKDDIQRLINRLFVVNECGSANVPDLNRDTLAPLLPALVTSLIHHYRDMCMCKEVAQGHKILHMLRSNVMAAMNVDGKEAHLKLMKWSVTIKNDFVLGNAIALGCKSPGDSDLQTIIMNQASCITNLANKIDGMMNKLEALEGAVASMDASAVALQHRKRGGGGGGGEEEIQDARERFHKHGAC